MPGPTLIIAQDPLKAKEVDAGQEQVSNEAHITLPEAQALAKKT
jgi:hypothetical protein